MTLSWNEIEARATKFSEEWKDEYSESAEKQTFWNDFFEVFGLNRRRVGAAFELAVNLRKRHGFIDVFLPGKLLAEHKSAGRSLKEAMKQGFDYLDGVEDSDLPLLVVSSDFRSFEVVDLETQERWEFPLTELSKNVRLFSVLLGTQRHTYVEATPVSLKAAEKVNAIYERLEQTGYSGHNLQLFLTRLVFCLFAEDSGIFGYKQFSDYVRNRTAPDGSDLGPLLTRLFNTLNTQLDSRSSLLDQDLNDFPYVNGSLFSEITAAPDFDAALREAILASSDPDWREVSPAIFGAMFQAVLDPETRSTFGSHYTSEENILRALKPLFLDDLYEKFEIAKNARRGRKTELEALHDQIASLHFLDPACGSGAFLIVAYRELRKLEHRILRELVTQTSLTEVSEHLKVSLDQFFGLEILESSALITKVSLWLVDHQMNLEASGLFGRSFVRLPLPDLSSIRIENAATVDWAGLTPELNYIIGNPPYSGSRRMSADQKQDLASSGAKNHKSLDYIAIWFIKAARLMALHPRVKTSYVATNSVSQGLLATLLWPQLLELGSQIDFAYRSFPWRNNAKGIAQVHVVIIGLSTLPRATRQLYEFEEGNPDPIRREVANINPYLIERSDNVVVQSETMQRFGLGEMVIGNMPDPAELLVYSEDQAKAMILEEPRIAKYLKPAWGSSETLQGKPRFALWLDGIPPADQRQVKLIDEIVKQVRAARLKGSRPGNADLGGRFAQVPQPIDMPFILIPRHFVSSLRALPAAFFEPGNVSLDSALTIPGGTKWEFALLSSRAHFVWMDGIGGRIKSDFRYSKTITYNNFPCPELDDSDRLTLTKSGDLILEASREYPSSSLADLYASSSVPVKLAKAFAHNDRVVEKIYGIAEDADDQQVLNTLLDIWVGSKMPKYKSAKL